MKSLRISTIALMLVLLISAAYAGDKTVEGELVGVSCYIHMNASGPDHQMCAQMCAKKGLPIGVATADGVVYTLMVAAPGYFDWMAKTVKIEGIFHEGTHSIKPAKMWVKEDAKWTEAELPKDMM